MSDQTVTTPNASGDLHHVWQPLQMRNVTLHNRILQPAHSSQHGDASTHQFSERQVAYFRERAMGGVALSVTETVSAARSSLGSFFHIVDVYDERTIPSMSRVGEGVHEHGGHLFVQLAAMGVHDRGKMFVDSAKPIWGVSRIPSLVHNEQPQVMGREEIRELALDFGQSAANVKAAGLDGVEIHGAHSYMLGQWLSPTYNKRTDGYGGSPEKRCQMVIDVAERVRERVGDDFVVGVRLSWEEFMGPEGGITAEQSEVQLEVLSRTGLFDYFSIAAGGYHTFNFAIPGMEGKETDGWLAPYSKRAKEIVGDTAKVFVVSKIRDLHTAEKILADGSADMVAMARQLLADPFIVKKTKEGREREIIRCNGNNECVNRLFEHREVICALNPISGRESYWGEGSRTSVRNGGAKRIVVVGGGPAGMKAAAVAANRGHDVTLLEASDRLGGHLKLLERLPGLEGWGIAIDNLVREMENNGVDVRLNSRGDVDAIGELRPDSVVVATGSKYETSGLSMYRPERPGIPGAELDHVLDVCTAARRALDDPASLGKSVLIVDETGGQLPLALAEVLATAGVKVEVLSPRMFIGEKTQKTLAMSTVFPKLKSLGVPMTAQYFVDEITADSVMVYDLWAGPGATETRSVDTVVLAILQNTNDELYFDAKGVFKEVLRIGDAVAPRDVTAVIYEGEKIGREL
jgi:2,4-dienoyl-CoA reductase-like NADH-dependent reductase (Old Yellow Enzyme family)/thioredoxin reductase